MARKIKIDNSILKRRARQEQKRKVGSRGQPREFFLIVCEGGKTEPNYFEGIRKTLPKGVVDCIDIEGTGKNTLSIIEEAIDLKERSEKLYGRKYDHVWAVFDRDSFPAEHFNNAINKGEQSIDNPIKCAWSNEAFELWFLLHFEFVNTATSRHDLGPRLSSHLGSKMGLDFTYQKNSLEMYELLQQFGNEDQAIKWAKKIRSRYGDNNFADQNPSTTVYLLIEELNRLKKPPSQT